MMSQPLHGIAAIEQAFAAAQAQGRPALLTYLTLGYPNPKASLTLVPALERGGVDLIELGVPFSDPIADGPVIQSASQTALQQGVTPASCLAQVRTLRAQGVTVPLVLMGYYNPILSYGPAAYVRDCAESGVDGLIVPDLPPEEAGELAPACRATGLALVYLVAPNTGVERMARLAAQTSGFLYVVLRLGITGEQTTLAEDVGTRLSTIKQVAHTPVAVGFGIARPEQVRALASQADGIIVGSAIVERATQGPAALEAYAAELRRAMDSTSEAR
ncbi:MAG: tryptophan synthase subunit alpha [Anaerolineales bacterium]